MPRRSAGGFVVPDFVKGALFSAVLIVSALSFASHKLPEQQKDERNNGRNVISPPSEASSANQKSETYQTQKSVSQQSSIDAFTDWLLDLKLSDFLLVGFTAVLAWKTAGLDDSTRKLWTAGEKQIRVGRRAAKASLLAAKAAESQVNNALRAELPIIVAQNVVFKPEAVLPDNQMPLLGDLRIKIENYGRTPAELISHCIEASVLKALPDLPDYYGDYDFPPGSFLTKDDPIIMPAMLRISEKDRDDLISGEKNIYLRGYIRFLDFTGTLHEVRFCRMSLYRDDRPGKWFDFVVSAHMPADYLKRT